MKRIKTERLMLRLLRMRDWQRLAWLDADFSASPYAAYDLPWPKDRRGIKRLTRQFVETRLFFAVLLDRKMIGYVCFCEEDGAYDVSYLIHSEHQRRGFATEAVAAALAYLASSEQVCRFTAMTASANLPSCRVLERLGFYERERMPFALEKDENGEPISFETVVFELAAEKFSEKRDRNEADKTV